MSTKFSRRHYVFTSKFIRSNLCDEEEDPEQRSALEGAATVLANMFEEDNPRFLKDRFYRACGLTEEK